MAISWSGTSDAKGFSGCERVLSWKYSASCSKGVIVQMWYYVVGILGKGWIGGIGFRGGSDGDGDGASEIA